MNCVRGHYICQGYTEPFIHVVQRHEEPLEGRSIQFFIEVTGPESAGYYDPEFFNRLVVQLCFSESTIRHLIIALSLLHESLEYRLNGPRAGVQRSSLYSTALSHCNKAIRTLVLTHLAPRYDVYLTACLLFFRFYAMAGDYVTAFKHLGSGQSVMTEFRTQPRICGGKSTELEDVIIPGMGRYELSTNVFENWTKKNRQHVRMQDLRIPEVFCGGLHEGRLSLGDIARGLIDAVEAMDGRSDASEFVLIQSRAKQALDEWHSSFLRLMDYVRKTSTPKVLRDGNIELANYLVICIMLQASASTDEMIYDRFLDDFAKINRYCSPAAADGTHEQSSGSWCSEMGGLSFDAECVPPLSFVACHCREPAIRRRAIASLKLLGRRRKFKSCSTLAAMYQWKMESEEAGSEIGTGAAGIIVSKRIRLLSWYFISAQNAVVVTYLSYPFSTSLGAKTLNYILPIQGARADEEFNGPMCQSSFQPTQNTFEDSLHKSSIVDHQNLTSLIDVEGINALHTDPNSEDSDILLYYDRPLCLLPFPLRDVEISLRNYRDRCLAWQQSLGEKWSSSLPEDVIFLKQCLEVCG